MIFRHWSRFEFPEINTTLFFSTTKQNIVEKMLQRNHNFKTGKIIYSNQKLNIKCDTLAKYLISPRSREIIIVPSFQNRLVGQKSGVFFSSSCVLQLPNQQNCASKVKKKAQTSLLSSVELSPSLPFSSREKIFENMVSVGRMRFSTTTASWRWWWWGYLLMNISKNKTAAAARRG